MRASAPRDLHPPVREEPLGGRGRERAVDRAQLAAVREDARAGRARAAQRQHLRESGEMSKS